MSTTSNTFNLSAHGLTVTEVHRNLSPSTLYEHAIRFEKNASIADNGALVAYSGAKTGRTPKDKRVVEHPDSKNDIWWGAVNIPCDERTFQINRQRALDYLNTRDRLYCFDGFAGWDPKYRSVSGGIGLVKLMGRHAGFVTAAATIANHDVNFALIPEVPFKLDVFSFR